MEGEGGRTEERERGEGGIGEEGRKEGGGRE